MDNGHIPNDPPPAGDPPVGEPYTPSEVDAPGADEDLPIPSEKTGEKDGR